MIDTRAYAGESGAAERPECEVQDCDRDATLIFEHWPEKLARRFCRPCYNAWDRGVRSHYGQGIPEPRPLNAETDEEVAHVE